MEQQKPSPDQNVTPTIQSSTSASNRKPQSTPTLLKNRTNEVLFNGKNSNRTAQQRRHDMTAMIAAASQHNKNLNHDKNSIQSDTSQLIPSDKSFKERSDDSIVF